MSTETEFAPVDRTGWAAGPWDNEPDRVEWRDSTGTPCLAVRNVHGAWCGYVALAAGHPWRASKMIRPGYSTTVAEDEADCHGGITYGPSPCQVGGKICHVPQPGEPDDVRWIGFDCGHAWDVQPGLDALLRKVGSEHGVMPGSLYRDLAYVRAEVEKLAAQALEAQS